MKQIAINKVLMKAGFVKFFLIVCASLFFFLLFWVAHRKSDLPLKVTIVMNPEKDDVVQLFYTASFRGFNEKESLVQETKSENQNSIYVFELPAYRIDKVRIDPGLKSEFFVLKSLKFETSQQSRIFEPQELLNDFEFKNISISNPSGIDSLILYVNNNDPQLIYKGSIKETFQRTHAPNGLVLKILIVLSYIVISLLILVFDKHFLTFIAVLNNKIRNMRFEKFNTEYILNYLDRNKIVILSSLFIGVLSFGYELFNFSLSIDDETSSLAQASDLKFAIVAGRWGLYLLNLFFHPYSLLPFYTTVLAVGFIAATASFFIIQQPGNLPSKLVFLIIFISSPIHSYYLAFNLSFYYAIGMLLSLISFLSFKTAIKNSGVDFKNYSFAIILLALSVSFYQAMIVFFLVFAVFFLFEEVSHGKVSLFRIRKIIVGLMIVVVFGLLFYKLGDFFSRLLFLSPNFRYSTTYLDNFTGWDQHSLFSGISYLFDYTVRYLTDINLFDAYLGIAEKTTLVFYAYLGYLMIDSGKSFKLNILTQIALLLLLLSPFVLIYLNGKPLPIRAMMSLALMIALLWFNTYNRAGAIIRRLMLLAAFLILINNTYINTRLFYASKTSWEADKNMAENIAERIFMLNPITENGFIKVAFIGNYQHPKNHLFFQSDVFGASFFYWDPDCSTRKFAFFQTIGINNFTEATKEEVEHYHDEIANMPSWPYNGSVALMDKIIIVKLSDQPKQ